MALFNYATKEITIKIVYYGPGLSGKTTNLQYLHSVLNPERKGKLLSLATEADRTLFFDFLPVELGKIREFSIRFQLYTVPGQVRYNATRKLVLRGADAIVFVADSQREMREQNRESLQNMYENLISNNIKPDDIPVILQYNKRDLSNILSVDELNKDINETDKYEYTESSAIDGIGVENTFQHITKLVLNKITERHKVKVEPAEELSETLELKAPHYEETVGFPSPEDIFPSTESFESEPTLVESVMYGQNATEPHVQEQTYDIPHAQKEPVQTSFEENVSELKEEIIKGNTESLLKHEENIGRHINEVSNEIIYTKEEILKLKKEIKDVKKDQKDIYVLLRDIHHALESMKEKKSWFRFS